MNKIYIGLDISKATIDVCIDDGLTVKHQTIKNTPTAHSKLIKELQENKDRIHVCCEYTGIYYYQIAKAFYEAGIVISVVNAYSIKSYARLTLRRTKTDKQDAKLIAEYCKRHQPNTWQPPNKHTEQLKSLTRRIEQLTKLRTMELNRQKVADSYTTASIEQTINHLSQQIQIIRSQLKTLIEQTPTLKHRQNLLTSIIGIGETTATILLSVFNDINRFPTAHHLVSYLGLSPIITQSGTSLSKSRISKMGDSFIRKSLYLPARTACTKAKVFKSWFEAQQAKGKHRKQIYVIMMRKLIIYAYNVIKTNTAFDASRVAQSPKDIILLSS